MRERESTKRGKIGERNGERVCYREGETWRERESGSKKW
jgi:hypothetical protein